MARLWLWLLSSVTAAIVVALQTELYPIQAPGQQPGLTLDLNAISAPLSLLLLLGWGWMAIRGLTRFRATDQTEPSGRSERAAGPVTIRSGRSIRLVDRSEIRVLAASGHHVVLHTDHGEHLVERSLESMLQDLQTEGFLRVHRSWAVRLDQIRAFRRINGRDFEIVLQAGGSVRLSRTYRKAVEAALGIEL